MPPTESRTIDHQYLIHVGPSVVFGAVSQGSELVRWLCDHAEVEPRPGGNYRLGWANGPTHAGRLAAFVAGRRIAFEWSWPGVDLAGTVFSLEVEPAEGGSLLRVRHSGFPLDVRWTDLLAGAEWGWTYFAMNLKSVLEGGRDLRSPSDG